MIKIKVLLVYSACITILFLIFLIKNKKLLNQKIKIEEYLSFKEKNDIEFFRETSKKEELTQCFYALHENKGDLIYLMHSKLGEILKVNNIFQIKREIKKLLKLEIKYQKFNDEQYEQILRIKKEIRKIREDDIEE
jgi:hypothetical protein